MQHKTRRSIRDFILKPETILVVYALLAIVASVQNIVQGTHIYQGYICTEYNNYVIFRQSFFHLIKGENMYIHYRFEHWDLYKYSPTFALAMGLLAYLPDVAGLSVWNIINAWALLAAIRMLPIKKDNQSLLLWFVVIELVTSLQNSQSNGLMAGLMIAAYGCLERGKLQWAALWIVMATFIKVYGAVGFCLFLFYPDKIKFILYSALWMVLFAIMPLAVTPFQTLVWQYHNWAGMMVADQSSSYGLSVMGWLHSWFGVNRGKNIVSIIGIILFMAPFARWKLYRDEAYKLMMLGFMLIWVIIFNHKAESPTFIIAVAGAGIWYFSIPAKMWRSILLAVVFIFTCLSPTDIFPAGVRDIFFIPYVIKAIPSILLWCVIWVELMGMKEGEYPVLKEAQ